MSCYIALLRGINVSGQKKIKMADLRAHLAELPFTSVQTYIQSGNIVFETTEADPKKLESLIREKIAEKYDFQVPTLVKQAAELKEALETNPFHAEASAEPKKMYFTFLADEPENEKVAAIQAIDYHPEQWALQKKTIFFYSPNGYGRAKLNNNFFEKKLKVAATTRNLRTTRILVEMAEKVSGTE